jgi:hypothetical protein
MKKLFLLGALLLLSISFTGCETEECDWVDGYYKANGTWVDGYYRNCN